VIRILLADDHPIVLDGLERLFRLEPDFEVVGRCRDGEETLARVRGARPDLVVLDLRMPRLDGLEVLRAIRAEQLPTRALVLTAAIEPRQVAEALRLGAPGLMLKETAAELIVGVARKILSGGLWYDPNLVSQAVGGLASAPADDALRHLSLTSREREIVHMAAQGLRNRIIAERLGITEGTVKLHLHHVYEKLGVAGRVELLLFAQKHALLV
jgi:two-component system, NarL family, nitrate/nitrite response regulator NarL